MSINSVFLVGRLGATPELRTTTRGTAVCSFRLATNRMSKEREEVAEWHSVVAWERIAETCHRYLDKGSQVAVEGRLNTRKWDGPDGAPRYRTEVVARRVTFLGGRGGDGAARAPGAAYPAPTPGPGGVAPTDDLPF